MGYLDHEMRLLTMTRAIKDVDLSVASRFAAYAAAGVSDADVQHYDAYAVWLEVTRRRNATSCHTPLSLTAALRHVLMSNTATR